MIIATDCSTHAREYWAHVSKQDELPIAAKGGDPVTREYGQLVEEFPTKGTDQEKTSFIARQLIAAPQSLHQLRSLVAVSDKRLYLDLSYEFSRTEVPGTTDTLCGCRPHELTCHSVDFFVNKLKSAGKKAAAATAASQVIATYLMRRGLSHILTLYSSLAADQKDVITRCLIAPKEAQQSEAKRRGHGAEAALAQLMDDLGVNFLPDDKITNPMGSHDPNVNLNTMEVVQREAGSTYAFDLLLLKETEIAACVQGLIQSSDPGQFGVNKSNETLDIRKLLDSNTNVPRVELWGLIDGVGYSENKENTVNKMLKHVHEFIQLKSLYKAGLAAHRLGLTRITAISFDPNFYSPEAMSHMARYVPSDVQVVPDGSDVNGARPVRAGMATLFL